MVLTAVVACVFMITDRTVARREGIILLVGYVVVLPFLA
jgi:Ca2+/Na+ antiporter